MDAHLVGERRFEMTWTKSSGAVDGVVKGRWVIAGSGSIIVLFRLIYCNGRLVEVKNRLKRAYVLAETRI